MEEEGSSVRLVRCPKCENLLPELPEYSVYQCGGCGGVLRGKQSTPAREKRPLERSDNENGVRVSEKKEKVSLESSGSLIDRENDEFELGRRQGKTVHEKISKLSASSSSKKEKRESLTDSDQIRRRRLDFDQTKVTVFNDWDMNVPKYGESQEIRHPFGPIRSRPIGIHRNSSTIENDRFGNSPYPEGPSSSHSYGGLNELTRVHDLENDRAQLLQKLDELRTQLTKSCNVTENPNVRLNAPYPWPHQPPPLPHQHPHHQYLPPTYHDPFIGYNQDSLFHRPSCTCPQCYNTNSHNILPNVRPFPSFNTRETTYPTHDPLTYNPRQLPRHLDSGSGSFGRRYPRRRVILSHGGERVSRPISGGAPFISCCNCFELLKIPKKLTFMEKDTHKKMKCAVCSSLISLTLEDNRIVTSVSPSHQKYKGTTSKGSVHSSRDYDKSGYNFQLTDTEPNSLSNEQSPDGLTDKPLFSAENFESQDDDLSHSQRVIVDQSIGNKKCLKDAMVATEIDVSLTDYLKCDGVSKEDDELKNKKGEKESFFAGLIKKRLKDFSRSSSVVEKGRSDHVFVNGQLLTDRAVKKAEKLAGPVHPGEYWYDSIAGFWGVMNQPCLGIIPPFIEEFDYTMPKNCAAGNTRVYVNGRELNQRDLDLLAGRGLPTTKDKSYIIDISGKVVDEDSGEELDGLGKLAPTVERVKHGFGMKVPKAVVSK